MILRHHLHSESADVLVISATVPQLDIHLYPGGRRRLFDTMSSQPPQDAPATPRSPRQPLPAPQPLPPDLELPPPRPRPNLSSMLFLTAFFFFMSGSNHAPATGGMEIGPDGEVRPRMSELEYVRGMRDEWRSWLNGTEGNYTEVCLTGDGGPDR